MKGLFYSMWRLNRGYFIGAAIAFLCSAVVGTAVLYTVGRYGGDTYGFGSLCVYILPLVPIVIISEFFARDLEKHISSGFLNYTLSSITRKAFMLSQLITNITCTGLGLLLGLELLLIFRVVNPEYVPSECFGGLALLALFASVVEWVVFPVTLKMKSAEKAGLAVGAVFGFAVVLPLILLLKSNSMYINLADLLNLQYVLLIIAASVVIYAVIFAICMRLLKRGVC